MKIALGTDHAGYELKEQIKVHLEALGHTVEDFGTQSAEACDYPLFVRLAAEAVADGRCERGIVLGGSGNGEAIVANRVRGVRCALCYSDEAARLGRAHNKANVISFGARTLTTEEALRRVDIWLETDFDGGRHERRIGLIDAD